MQKKTDAERIETIKKILNILHNYKSNKSEQEMLNKHNGDYNDKLFAITGKEIHDAQHAFSCGHWAKVFVYENSLLPRNDQLDIKIMVSTHPDHLIDSYATHTLPCVKMADGNYYAIDPQFRRPKIPMIDTPIVVDSKIKHILPGMDGYPEYKIMALVDWKDERLYDFNKFTKMASERSKKTQNIISEIDKMLKFTVRSKRQFYIFCDEMIKQKPEIAKQMRVAVIEQKDNENHVIEPLNRIVIALETADGQKQTCYFAPIGDYAKLLNVDTNHKILRQMSLARYLELYNNMDKTEEYLLKNSSIDDLITKTPKTRQNVNTILSKQEIRKDISTLARILIRGYVGWPYHHPTTQIAVLDLLKDLYDNAQEMSIKELQNKIKQIPNLIPDNHLCIVNTRNRFRQPFFGENIANNPFVFVTRTKSNGLAIVAANTLNFNKLESKEKRLLNRLNVWGKDFLPESNALIIDLRGNRGGNSGPTDNFASYLCGGVINYPTIREFVRTTPEANKITPIKKLKEIKEVLHLPDSEEPQLYQPSKGIVPINKDKAYMKPIYILIDKRTASSAERFILAMRHHPMVRFVGDNSGGTEVFGDMSSEIYLPHSNAVIRVGTHYRDLDKELGHDRYELHGLKPDIRCNEGEDAMQVALQDIDKHVNITKFQHATRATKIKQAMLKLARTVTRKHLKNKEKTI